MTTATQEPVIPSAIKRQKRKADELRKQLENPQQHAEPTVPGNEPELGLETPPAGQEPVVTTPEPVQPQQPETPPQVEPQQPLNVEQLRAELERSEQRFRSLDGRIQARDREIMALRQEIAGIRQQPPSPPQQPLNAADAGKKFLKPGEADTIGNEAVDATSRIAQGVAQGVVSEENQKVLQQMKAMQDRFETERLNRYVADLRGMVKDFDTLNESDEFIYGFLQQTDDLTGTKLKQLFDQSVQDRDASRTARFFQRFIESKGGVQQPPPRPKVAEIVTPTPSSARVAPPPPVRAKQVTTKDIEAFYREMTREMQQGRMTQQRMEEFKRKEQELMQAAKDGRVQRVK